MNKPRTTHEQVTSAPKKPYRKPRLVEYGDLQKITMTKGSNMADAPLPATKK